MTREDARKLQQLAASMTHLNLPSDSAAKPAREMLADMIQTSSLILPNGPDKVDGGAFRKLWPIDGDPVAAATANTIDSPEQVATEQSSVEA